MESQETHLPDKVKDKANILELISHAHSQIRIIQEIEAKYISAINKDLNTLTSKKISDYVNNHDEYQEKWAESLLKEISQIDCLFKLLDEKINRTDMYYTDSLDYINKSIGGPPAPEKPKGSSIYEIIKEQLFG